MFNQFMWYTATITDANILLNLRSMQEVDDKKLSDLSKRFLQAISYCGLSGYKLKKDNIISSESTLTSIKKGIQLPSKKTIDAFCEKYDVSRAWLYTGEGLFAKTPSGQIEPSEKDIRDALKIC